MTYTPQRRKEDRGAGRLGVFFARFFIVVGVGATVSFLLLLVTLKRGMDYAPPPLPEKIVLSFTFRPGLSETAGKPSLAQPWLRPSTTLRHVTAALHDAAKDARVKGFIAKMEGTDLSIAQIQELRDAVHMFRKEGKFAWIYADSYGSLGPGMADYYLAAAFDAVWMQPVGVVAVNGIAAEVPFGKGFLDKIGVSAQFNREGRYKTMPESLTRTGMSPAYREMMEALVGDLAAQMEEDIARDRGFSAAAMRAKIDGAPYGDDEAVGEKLVDRLGYYDEMVAAARNQAGIGDKGVVNLKGYAFSAGDDVKTHGMISFTTKMMRDTAPPGAYRDKAKIALVYGAGDIVPYARQAHAGFGGGGMAADRVAKAFESAMEDPDVAAIVFRVDSPGGSPVAAETIRRAILRAREKGKPVVVSMSGYAASGGYWVAAPADVIVAQPGTVTGSIGVFGGKFDLSGMWEKLGVRWDSVARGENARMWSMNRPFTPAERARFEAMLSGIYDDFIARVAEGRGMTPKAVRDVAEGRVWTGRQALDIGLVDALGGLEAAVQHAKRAAGLPLAQDVPVLQFPPQKTAFEMFLDLAVDGADAALPFFGIGAREVMDALDGPLGMAVRMPVFYLR